MIQTLSDRVFTEHGVQTDVLRLDLMHPEAPGNKWFKLKYFLQDAIDKKKSGIISCGGAYSNHLVAMAAACRSANLAATAIVRSDARYINNPSINEMRRYGMELLFANRAQYKEKEGLVNNYLATHPEYDYIPEGGSGAPGVKGASDIITTDLHRYTHIVCATGTGTTMAGLLNGCAPQQQVIGISALKLPAGDDNTVLRFIRSHSANQCFHLLLNYHFGGYARRTAALVDFMNDLYRRERIPTDFVYTGKLFYAVFDLVKKRFFPEGALLLVIHSGGLQGNRSLAGGVLEF